MYKTAIFFKNGKLEKNTAIMAYYSTFKDNLHKKI